MLLLAAVADGDSGDDDADDADDGGDGGALWRDRQHYVVVGTRVPIDQPGYKIH